MFSISCDTSAASRGKKIRTSPQKRTARMTSSGGVSTEALTAIDRKGRVSTIRLRLLINHHLPGVLNRSSDIVLRHAIIDRTRAISDRKKRRNLLRRSIGKSCGLRGGKPLRFLSGDVLRGDAGPARDGDGALLRTLLSGEIGILSRAHSCAAGAGDSVYAGSGCDRRRYLLLPPHEHCRRRLIRSERLRTCGSGLRYRRSNLRGIDPICNRRLRLEPGQRGRGGRRSRSTPTNGRRGSCCRSCAYCPNCCGICNSSPTPSRIALGVLAADPRILSSSVPRRDHIVVGLLLLRHLPIALDERIARLILPVRVRPGVRPQGDRGWR